jgi:hypothetical protein
MLLTNLFHASVGRSQEHDLVLSHLRYFLLLIVSACSHLNRFTNKIVSYVRVAKGFSRDGILI